MEIYLITNRINGKQYVGMTTRGYNLRFEEHLRQAKTDKYKIGLHGAIKKYGACQFDVSLIDTANSIEDLCEKEIHLINQFNTMAPNGYNLKSGGYDGFYAYNVLTNMSRKSSGKVISAETRAKISKAHKGRPRTKCQIDSVRNRSIGNKYCLGRKLTDEHKTKISMGNSGKVRSDETKSLLSSINSGDKHPQADKSVYDFYNKEYGVFTGTRCAFTGKFGFRPSHLFGKSKRKTYKGWSLYDTQ